MVAIFLGNFGGDRGWVLVEGGCVGFLERERGRGEKEMKEKREKHDFLYYLML